MELRESGQKDVPEDFVGCDYENFLSEVMCACVCMYCCVNILSQDLRCKYSGAVPLSDQEKFTELVIRLQENQRNIEDDLKKVEICHSLDVSYEAALFICICLNYIMT